MGGHGGLNILPQKKWNVYRADRQFEVKYDEHRDIERRLAEGDKRKRERLTDSLVELRRKSQAVNQSDNHTSSNALSHLDERHGKTSRRRERHSRRRRDDDNDKVLGETRKNLVSKPLEPPLGVLSEDGYATTVAGSDTKSSTIEFDKKASGGHVNLFEEEEREAEETAQKHRENLIKSGAYIYNSGGKGPRSVNVYTDDASVTLVPDFKEIATPWYLKPGTEEPGSTGMDGRRKGGPRYLTSVSTFDRPSAYREEEELKKSFATKLANFYSKKALPKV